MASLPLIDGGGTRVCAAGGGQLGTASRAGPVAAVLLERCETDASSAGVEVCGVLNWPGHAVSIFDLGDLGPKDLLTAFVMRTRSVKYARSR